MHCGQRAIHTCCAHDNIDSVGNGPYTFASAAAVLYCHILPAGGGAAADEDADAVEAPAEGTVTAEPK